MKAIVDLTGRRGLVAGIANDSSIAYGCARAFREAGAELAVTYLNAKAEPHVRPLAEALGAPIIVPCDVRQLVGQHTLLLLRAQIGDGAHRDADLAVFECDRA